MAVARTATVTGNRATGSSASLATTATCNTATTGMDHFAIVGVTQSVSTNSAQTTCTVTCGGVAMQQVDYLLFGSSTNRGAVGIFMLQNPPTGAQNVIATSGGTSTKTAIACGGAVYSGAAGLAWLTVANSISGSISNVPAGGMAFSVACNGAAITSPNQTSLYLAGSLVTGLADYISVQTGSPTGGAVSFTNSGTATTPRNRQVVILPTPVSKLATLTDDFATQDTAKWNFNGGAAATGGQLVIPCLSTYAGAVDTAGKATYDLTASEAVIEAVTRPNQGTGTTEWYMQLDAVPWSVLGNNLITLVSDAQIYFQETVGGVADSTTITYDPVAHRWWRIRESGGSILWDTSPDGTTWTNRKTKTRAIPVTSMMPNLYAGYYGTETTPGNGVFDNFNLAPSVSTGPSKGVGFFRMM